MPVGVSVRKSKIHGTGVFANRDFGRDEFVLEIDDSDPVKDRSKLSPGQIVHLDEFIDKDGRERVVFMKSPERYVNHSCDPNILIRTDMASGIRRAHATTGIRRGEEITWDYELNSWEKWETVTPCYCGSKDCRGIIQGRYFDLPKTIQKRNLALLDEPFRKRFAAQLRGLEKP